MRRRLLLCALILSACEREHTDVRDEARLVARCERPPELEAQLLVVLAQAEEATVRLFRTGAGSPACAVAVSELRTVLRCIEPGHYTVVISRAGVQDYVTDMSLEDGYRARIAVPPGEPMRYALVSIPGMHPGAAYRASFDGSIQLSPDLPLLGSSVVVPQMSNLGWPTCLVAVVPSDAEHVLKAIGKIEWHSNDTAVLAGSISAWVPASAIVDATGDPQSWTLLELSRARASGCTASTQDAVNRFVSLRPFAKWRARPLNGQEGEDIGVSGPFRQASTHLASAVCVEIGYGGRIQAAGAWSSDSLASATPELQPISRSNRHVLLGTCWADSRASRPAWWMAVSCESGVPLTAWTASAMGAITYEAGSATILLRTRPEAPEGGLAYEADADIIPWLPNASIVRGVSLDRVSTLSSACVLDGNVMVLDARGRCVARCSRPDVALECLYGFPDGHYTVKVSGCPTGNQSLGLSILGMEAKLTPVAMVAGDEVSITRAAK